MTKQKAVIAGTGGHAQVLWATFNVLCPADAELAGWLEKADPSGPDSLFGHPVYPETEAGFSRLQQAGVTTFYLGIGMVKSRPKRFQVYERLCQAGLIPLTLVHPTAIVSPEAMIEPGCFIGAGVIVQPFAHIEAASILNTGCIIEHHVRIGKNTHIAPGATVCGEGSIGDHSLVGAGAVVIQSCRLGQEVIVGAGSVVLESFPDGVTVVGQPAQAKQRQSLSSMPLRG